MKKRYLAVFWVEKIVRRYMTVQAENEAEARELFEDEKDMTLDHEELCEITDGGNLLEEYGITECQEHNRKESGITREQFMDFFRSDDFHSKITPDDAEEIFCSVMHGSGDFSVKLFNDILADYDAEWRVTEDASDEESEPVGYYNKHNVYCTDCVKSFQDAMGKIPLSHGEKLQPFRKNNDIVYTLKCFNCGKKLKELETKPEMVKFRLNVKHIEYGSVLIEADSRVTRSELEVLAERADHDGDVSWNRSEIVLNEVMIEGVKTDEK